MFNVPVKEIIVNDDSQVRLLAADGTAFTGTSNITPTSGGFILEGFLGPVLGSQVQLLSAATRIRKTVFSAGTAETAAFTITAAAGAKRGDTYRVVTDSLDLTPTEYQNRPTEKRYQLSVDCANPTAIATELAARINADKSAQVNAFVGETADAGKIVLVAKRVGVTVSLHVGEYNVWDQTTYTVSLTRVANATAVDVVTAANQTTAAAALPVGTYDALKNINWAKNFHIDQNLNWMPLPGTDYDTYYFEVNGPVSATLGNDPIPNEIHNSTRYGVRLYVRNNLTLETALDFLVTDLNV